VSIAFYAVRDGQADIFTIPPEGGELTNVTGDAPPDSDPKWSPDGRRLAFDSRREDGERNIWVLEPDGTFQRLTSDTGANNSFPTWSPDGQQIAYVHDGEIWVMNSADGSDGHAITSGANDGRPSWGVTGQILFQRTSGSNVEIWTVPADGSAEPEVVIGADAGGGRQPAWSPDASQIAYVVRLDGVLRIVVADGTGASPTTITTGAPCPCQFPTWSPDGTRIAFSGGTAKAEQIYVVPATGGSPKRITDGQGQNLVPGWGS
jgi:TolB protein